MLKPQDIVLALKLVCKEGLEWSQASLAGELVMSASEVNAGLKRLATATLIELHEDGRRWQVVKPALKEFLIHGVKYVFPAEKGAPCIGLPTSNASYPLNEHVSDELGVPVWPMKGGKVKGFCFSPLYPTVAKAAQNDPELYAFLSLVDALRDTDNDQVDVAQVMLRERLTKKNRKSKPLSSEKENISAQPNDQQLDLLSL